jgi:putative acetyltransferase
MRVPIAAPITERRIGRQMLTIRQVETPDEIASVRALIREYTTWAFTLETEAVEAPTFADMEQELASLPGIYSPPSGRLLLATWDGEAAGCIALKPHHGTTGELKRLYVQPSARGHDIGRHLVERLVAEARASGYRRLVLDSYHTMTRAHALYRAVGFRDVAAPDDFPREFVPVVVFMEADLEPSSTTSAEPTAPR